MPRRRGLAAQGRFRTEGPAECLQSVITSPADRWIGSPVSLAIHRGRRLYHGLPFAVFALDLRDPLGLCLTQLLHELGDARSVEQIRRRAERRDRAPVIVVPSSATHVLKLRYKLENEEDAHAREGSRAATSTRSAPSFTS